jgi:HK97 family phage major capsid protein
MPSLTEQSRTLRQERAKHIVDARAILDKAEAEKRDLNQEEQNQYDGLFSQADELRGRIERIERQAQAEGELEQSDRPIHVQADSLAQIEEARQTILAGRTPNIIQDAAIVNPALHRYFRITEEDRAATIDQVRRLRTFQLYLPRWIAGEANRLTGEEARALQADLDVSGGYLRPPEQFVDQLIKNIDDATYLRQWATTFTVTSAESMGVPTLENDPADADWTSELATGNEDNTMSFGKRNLHPHPLAKRIKISKKLIRAMPNAEGFVRQRLAYKFGITFEKGLLTGSGSDQPLGVFTASPDGISTSRDISTGNTSTAVTFDGLKEAKYALKAAYLARARWLFHRDGVKQIDKLKTGDGEYHWEPSTQVGKPDMLLGIPLFMSEYVPNTFTADNYVGVIGDFSFLWVVDALTFELQMLMELYAETNQVGLIGRIESDGQPVLEEAFARVTLAS